MKANKPPIQIESLCGVPDGSFRRCVESGEAGLHILLDQDTPLIRITREIKRSGGEITFRDLKKSHCFTDSKIRKIVGENLDKLEIFIWQNPAGGPRSERVRMKQL